MRPVDDAADAFQRMLHSLLQISKGASFCEDRGFGWDMEKEKAQGRDFIAEMFAAFPELGRMMPDHAAALKNGTLMGDVMSGEVTRARAHFKALRARVVAPSGPPQHGMESVDVVEAMRRILPALQKIEQLSSYCEDQGFNWPLSNEDEIGRAAIAEAFAAHPRLSELMPIRAKLLAEGLPLGDADDFTEIDAAKTALNIDPPKPRRQKKGAS